MSYQILRQDHESEVKAIYTGSAFLQSSAAGDNVGLVLTSSSFYAEQGGQVIHFIWYALFFSECFISNHTSDGMKRSYVHLGYMYLIVTPLTLSYKNCTVWIYVSVANTMQLLSSVLQTNIYSLFIAAYIF